MHRFWGWRAYAMVAAGYRLFILGSDCLDLLERACAARFGTGGRAADCHLALWTRLGTDPIATPILSRCFGCGQHPGVAVDSTSSRCC